ncbi:MAG TPA: PEGA domain-containing protein [Gemmatimonadales bacterium]|jgi:serine/threonine-protein kinase|nr:PEGA domain-containing protein [Gemmatimonadales bacterium]
MDSRGRSEPGSAERFPRWALNRSAGARCGGIAAKPAPEAPRDELDAVARRELGVGPAITPPQARPAFALAAQRVLFVKAPVPVRRPRRWRAAAAVVALLAAGEFGLDRLHRPAPTPPQPSTPRAALAQQAALAQPGPIPPELPPAPSAGQAPPEAADVTPAPPVPKAPARAASSRPLARPHATRAASRTVLPPSPPGRLFVNSRPWGLLYLDGRLVGNTPVVDFVVPPGVHRLRIVRNGFRPLDRRIRLAPRQELRMENLVLAAEGP